jgi:phosphoadenosine phosphosulfate reductase
MSNLDKKVERAIRLLQAIPSYDIELAFSGGKDSSVILKLAQMAGIKFTPIYKNTTIDPSGNIQFCKSMGCTITPPHKTFFELVQERGFPTRRARFCCEVLKEYKIKDYVIIGVRKAESTARTKRYNEPEICRVYGNKGKKKANGSNYCKHYLPIVNWTDEDVREFIEKYDVKCNPLYYVDGKFDVTKRLGCICCPLQSIKKQQADFLANPRMVRLYIRNGLVWWNKNREKEIQSKKNFGTIYDLFYHNVFCKSYAEYLEKKHSLFGNLDCKKFLEDFFKVKLD